MKIAMHRKLMGLVAVTLTICAAKNPAFAEESIYIPIPSYRVGPYAAGGTGYFGGKIDYFNLLNKRDGGINGVKLIWSECETEYSVERGVECYKRMKDRNGGALYFDSLSVGINTALTETGTADKIPLVLPDGGKTEGQDGEVFPYLFHLGINTFDEVTVMLAFVGQQEGGMENLKGKKIVTLFHGSPYGKEANSFLDSYADKYGYSYHPIEVPHPGVEQQSQWLQIRKLKPDWVLLRGWGVMNPVAMQSAKRTGFPVNRIIGNIWSGSDEDVIPAGIAADGYHALTTHPAGTNHKVIQEIINTVYKAGDGDLDDKSRIGSVYWNLGIMAAIYHTEAIRVAMNRFGNRRISSVEYRWGLENLVLDRNRLQELGAGDLVPPIEVTCKDHTGGHLAKIQQWDANTRQWHIVTDWIKGDVDAYISTIENDAKKYAADNKVRPRNCNNANDRDNWDL